MTDAGAGCDLLLATDAPSSFADKISGPTDHQLSD